MATASNAPVELSHRAVEQLRAAGSAVASDAIGGDRCPPFDIRPITEAVAFCGPALTVLTDPGDNRAAYEALTDAQPGDVLVISCADALDVAMVGGALAGHCRNVGVAAIVTDGLVRDVAALQRTGIPVWARGVTPAAPTKLTRGTVGQPIALGKVHVARGDVMLGDLDGITVLPAILPPDFEEKLRHGCERETQLESGVASGRRKPRWLDDLHWTEAESGHE